MAGGGRKGPRPGRDHHRQAAPRPDRHDRTAIRRRHHEILDLGEARPPAGADRLRHAVPAWTARIGAAKPLPMAEGEPAVDQNLAAPDDGRADKLITAGPPAAQAGGILTVDLAAIEANWRSRGHRCMPGACAPLSKATGRAR